MHLSERPGWSTNGVMAFILLFVLMGLTIWRMAVSFEAREPVASGLWTLVLIVELIGFAGFFMLEPNQAAALTFFGRYKGTVRETGPRWTNPFYRRHKISTRVRNFETATLKVNELGGSPIEIAAVVVWRVRDTAEALFGVDNYEDFVATQAEAALRQTATRHPYDADEAEAGQLALRSNAEEISHQLRSDIEERLDRAGIEVIEARISHLAYAPEIAGAMLQRQQAAAVIAARRRIVDGAVSIVEMALDHLEKSKRIALDDERRAAMVSNLLVVLCADHAPRPVINTGSLY
ncbi:MAG: SPFH domain-containing protein [Alphaproteobacteria bacterium]|nr:MAG: SPFH domain-containing protein [Alphaproteobacteria bacterium]